MSAVVQITDLSVWFDKLQVINNISLEVKEGEFVTIVGPSGCGKSTLLRVISGTIPGLIKAQLQGKVTVLGTLPSKLPAGKIDMIFQEGNLLPWRTAAGNARLGVEVLRANHNRHAIDSLLHSVGLSGFENAHPRELSGGMRQRVALASSLLTRPELLLMDEPFGALDSFTREGMWQVLTGLRYDEAIKSVVLITHDPLEAAVLADRIIVMSQRPGTVVAQFNVNIPDSRILPDGSINDECLHYTNIIRNSIKEANGD